MTTRNIADLPGSSKMEIRPLVTEEPAPGPYVEIANARLRRAGTAVECEASNPEGEWFHWYVDDDPSPHGIVSLGQSMLVPRALARKVPNSDSARLAERYAPRAAALARYSATNVDGATAVVFHLPTPTDKSTYPPGLAIEDAHLTTLLLVPLEASRGTALDVAWVEGSALVLNTAWGVASECIALSEQFFKLPSSEQQRLLEAPATYWEPLLARGAAVAGDIVKLADAFAKVVKGFQG